MVQDLETSFSRLDLGMQVVVIGLVILIGVSSPLFLLLL